MDIFEIIFIIIAAVAAVILSGKLLAKFLLSKGKIHQCKSCGDYVLKEEIGKHLEKHLKDGA